MFSIHPEYILLKRKIDENTIHSILYFFKKIQNLKKISKEIKYTLPSGDHIYIFEKGKFHKIGTYMFRILYNSSYNKKVEENYFPYGPMNKTPELVSFTEEKEWKDINLHQCIDRCNQIEGCVGFSRENVNDNEKASCYPKSILSQCHSSRKGDFEQRQN